jgi:outer membrane protein OmpA-like peptidoglycan-associated protein
MHLQSLVVSLLLATSAATKGNQIESTKAVSESGQCKEMVKLNKLVELASNTTKLDAITKNNATKIAEIQAKASTASTTLKTLESNSTLVSACAVINAQAAEKDQCQETFALQRFVKFAANSTAVATATQNNATKIANIQSEASNASTKLQTLTSNSTLQAACPAVMQKDECDMMKMLQKFVDVANNQTKLNIVAKGNTTKEAEVKAKAAKVQTKLTAMMSNATFMAACAVLEGKGTTAGNGISSTNTKSAASMLKDAGVVAIGLSTILVVMVGMFAL